MDSLWCLWLVMFMAFAQIECVVLNGTTRAIVTNETLPMPKSLTTPAPTHSKYANCTDRPIIDADQQPSRTSESRVRKCCPLNHSYEKSNVTGRRECVLTNVAFNATIIDAIFYDKCIEDSEKPVHLDYEIGNSCDQMASQVQKVDVFFYNADMGDILYVLQNGSLLLVDAERTRYGYFIFDDYCLDMHGPEKILTAIVCVRPVAAVSRGEAFVYATCLLVSVPCLLLTAALYFCIDELRDLHGKSLACHSICLAMAFIFLSMVQISGSASSVICSGIQYFMMACVLWLTCMCADVCSQVWYCLPRTIIVDKKWKQMYFIGYCIISFGLPVIPVCIARSKQVLGVPLYYLKGISSNAPSTHLYFIPPIAIALTISFALLSYAYYGLCVNKPELLTSKRPSMTHSGTIPTTEHRHIDYELYQDILRCAKSTAFLYTVMTLCTVFEIISFFAASFTGTSTAPSPLAFFDILIALQGVVIFIIFVCLPVPKQIIQRWWISRGSLDLHMAEMEALN